MSQMSIELDLVLNENERVEDLAETAFGPVSFELVQEHGPAGGNPVYRLTGTDGQLLCWLLEHYTVPGMLTGNVQKHYKEAVNDALYFLNGEGSYKIK